MELNNQQKIDLLNLALNTAVNLYEIDIRSNKVGNLISVDTNLLSEQMTTKEIMEKMNAYSAVGIVPSDALKQVTTVDRILRDTNSIFTSLKDSL